MDLYIWRGKQNIQGDETLTSSQSLTLGRQIRELRWVLQLYFTFAFSTFFKLEKNLEHVWENTKFDKVGVFVYYVIILSF